MSAPLLTVRGAHRALAGNPVLNGANLDLTCGRVTALLGPSGSGKSTLLRAIAGLERLDAGEIRSGDQLWSARGHHLEPESRRVGVVFQDFALFPHLTAAENVGFGLRGIAKAERRERAITQLERAELAHRADAYPHELSGGEQQRVALARALVFRPDLVLLDEPFSGLDRRLRAQLRTETVAALRAAGLAALLVTHDAEEAMEAADDIALMAEGVIVQTGTPEDVYLRPASLLAARLLGDVQTWSGKVESGLVQTPLGPANAADLPEGCAATVLIRPEGVDVVSGGVPAAVLSKRLHGGRARLVVQAGGEGSWTIETPLSNSAEPGQTLEIALNPLFTRVFPD